MKNSKYAFVWVLERPALTVIFSWLYFLFFLIPADIAAYIKRAKKIGTWWNGGLDVATFITFSVLIGIGLSFVIDKISHGWKLRTLETLLFIGGAVFWLGVFVFAIEYSRDLWNWIKRKMDW